jgi:hypothetical protein
VEPGSYLVRSLDHPERVVVIHLEVVDREVIADYEREIARLRRENERLRAGRVA